MTQDTIDVYGTVMRLMHDGLTNIEIKRKLPAVDLLAVRNLRAAIHKLGGPVDPEYKVRDARLASIASGNTPVEHARVLLRDGFTNREVLAEVNKAFPGADMSLVQVSQERSRLRRDKGWPLLSDKALQDERKKGIGPKRHVIKDLKIDYLTAT